MQKFYACVGSGLLTSKEKTDNFESHQVPVDLLLAFAEYLDKYPPSELVVDISKLKAALTSEWGKMTEDVGVTYTAGVNVTKSIPISFKPPVWEQPNNPVGARYFVHPYFVIGGNDHIAVAKYKKDSRLGEFYCHQQFVPLEDAIVGLTAYIDEAI